MRLRYTLPALADLDEALGDITERSPLGARRVRVRIQGMIDLLLEHPHIGSPTNDPTIRRMRASPYRSRIFYAATETEIVIHAVRHGARDPAGMPGNA
ncbi:MAG TPA: type II toxin-antitoxin system RelE/ParE family toxin [Acetobacteraceae bacterium]|nr:type II toxin-antitoxin system RelE/ParE family toxin [Acetobacteraceae bacterium]